jgi:NDP-sugar pyrophosphorylase family protein
VQVVILAGGLGTRLQPLTAQVPKPMVPVAGVPYLEHQLRLLARQSLGEIVMLTGYLGEQIEAYFGDGRRLGLRIRYCREAKPMGTGGAIREARGWLAESFLVIYGDSYLPIEYYEVGRSLAHAGAAAVMAVYHDTLGETNVRPNVAVAEDGAVVRYDKRAPAGASGLEYIEAGVLALRRTVLDLLPPAGAVSLEEETFPMLVERRWLFAYPTGQRFYDMGTPERLKAIEEYLA